MSKLDSLRKEMKALKSKMKKESKAALKAGFKNFFDEHPIVEAICWEQYTPYFNDGDPCHFGVGDFWLKFVKTEQQKIEDREQEKKFAVEHKEPLSKWAGYLDTDDAAHEDYDNKSYPWGDEPEEFTKAEAAAAKAIKKLYKAVLDEDTFHDMFGDHVRVKADRKGFYVDEYQHD